MVVDCDVIRGNFAMDCVDAIGGDVVVDNDVIGGGWWWNVI